MQHKQPRNKNYCAVVVSLDTFVELAGCDNVRGALIFGNQVIVSRESQKGAVGLFFPLESALSPEFLKNNNLYRDSQLNADTRQKGYFEAHGRVRAVKFRGHKSEGFWVPLVALSYTGVVGLAVGDEFDFIGDHEICRKYVPDTVLHAPVKRAQSKKSSVPDNFRFHYDTENLRRNVHKFTDNTIISVSDKWHGTSAVIARLSVSKKLSLLERLAKFFGASVNKSESVLVWSSRRVVKGVGSTVVEGQHFYGSDVWGVVAKEVESKIPEGYTLYGEIVGYTPEGSPIQPGYFYGCKDKEHRFLVYRVTYTAPNGTIFELGWPQMLEFCEARGLEHVVPLYYGTVRTLCGQYPETDFVSVIQKLFLYEGLCPYNDYKVPAEGVVIRIDHVSQSEAYKLKNYAFLQHETKMLDKGTGDMEDAA